MSVFGKAVILAKGLLGTPCFLVDWGGRTRLVSGATARGLRYSSAKWAPAYRWSAQVVREVTAVWAALRSPERLPGGLEVNGWPPDSLRHLRALDAIVGTPGPNQSVLVRFVESGSGRPRAIAKVMVSRDSHASARIAAESSAIQDPMLNGRVPRHLETGVINGHHYLVSEFVTGRSITSGHRGTRAARDTLAFQTNSTDCVAIKEHPWVQRALGQIPWLRQDRLIGRFAITRTHGDLAPWNILVRPTQGLTMIDWEFSESDGVAGVDLAHYVLVRQHLLKRRDALSATRIGAVELQHVGGYAAADARTLMALAAASVLLREPKSTRAYTGSFWQRVIEHCQG